MILYIAVLSSGERMRRNDVKDRGKADEKILITMFLILMLSGLAGGGGVYKAVKMKRDESKNKGRHAPYGLYEAFIKRLLDMLLGGLALVVLSPVMVVTALLVKKKLGSPVFFVQKRPGLNGEVFKIYKFRTMTNECGNDGRLLPDEARLTAFGKMLRSTSLDELPELFNIIRGDMSFVGPRPLLVEYLEHYNESQRHRHDVRPGLTGLAQIRGRNKLSWEEKFEYDVKYVEKITFLGDLKILVDTVGIVFNKEGISSNTSDTMELFTGSEE